MFQTALLPVSLHEPVSLVQSLVRFLRNFDTRSVVLVHIVSSGLENTTRARKRLQKLADTLRGEEMDANTIIRSGSPALEVSRTALDRQASFIAIPWQKKDFLQRTLLGSTSEDIVRLSDVPVFIYKEQRQGETNGQLQRVLYSTTFNAWHSQILPYLQYEGLQAKTLYLLHVGKKAPDPDAEEKRRKFVFGELERLKEKCESCFDQVKFLSVVGNPRWGIPRAAKQVGANLIVMGRQEEAPAFEKALGSSAEAATHKSLCSLLIVPIQPAERLGEKSEQL